MQIKSEGTENPLLDQLPLFLAQAPRPTPRSSTTSPTASSSSHSLDAKADNVDERPVPFGWEKQVSTTGRVYYINHHQRKTTWEHPLDAESDSTVEFDHNLPPGWEKRKNAAGRVFYLDHNAGITTWVDPLTDAYRGSPLAPLQRKLTYLASHLWQAPPGIAFDQEDLWVSQDSLFEDSVEAVLGASNATLMKRLGIRFLDDTLLPFQDWIDILFSELFSPDRGLFKPSEEHPSQVEINISYLGRNSLRLYTFAGRLHALAVMQQTMFNLSFLPTIYSALEDYDARGALIRWRADYQSEDPNNPQLDDSVFLIEKARALRMEAFMDAFVELIPPHVLRVFTLSEMHVILAAGRRWPAIEAAFANLPDHVKEGESQALPSHTGEQLLDELMLKLTGLRIETSQYIEELT